MNVDIMKEHIRKVNKTMAFLLISLSVILCFFAFIGEMPILIVIALVYTGIAIFVGLSYRKRKFEILSSYVIITLISIITIFVLPDKEFMFAIIMPVAIAAMYLNKRLFTLCSLFLNIGIILKEFIQHNLDITFLSSLILIDLIIIVLFFLSKWGLDIINLAIAENEKNVHLFKNSESEVEIIKTNLNALNRDLGNCNFNLEAVKVNSDGVSNSVQEIARGVIEQTESVTNISEMMNDADKKVDEVSVLSKQLSDISSNTRAIVLEGSEKINIMDKQMNIINQTVTKSFSTVQELNASMDEVNNFLSSITQISDQTNLLSLNAAIEAARAGESGKGFAVVADEIRKLAEQSSTTADQIGQIITHIMSKTRDVLIEVQDGNAATKEGELIVKEVGENFDKINLSFKDIDTFISDELTKIENMSSLFSQIRLETESIASISEEHSAATEELTATTQEHNANIETIYNLMLEIQASSDNLQSIIKQ